MNNLENKDNILTTDEIRTDYVLIYKDQDMILDNIGFSEKDRLICKSIVDHLEHEASIGIRENKCVSIPFLGTIQRNWFRKALISHYKDFKKARETMNSSEYKEYTRKIMEKEKDEHFAKENKIKSLRKFKRKMLPIWTNLCKNKSIVYANAWLKTHSKYEIVELDKELEEIYERFGY